MIERHDGEIEMVCDEARVADCTGAFVVYGADDLDVLCADARAAGWRAFRRRGAWLHACPACTAAFGAQQRGGQLL